MVARKWKMTSKSLLRSLEHRSRIRGIRLSGIYDDIFNCGNLIFSISHRLSQISRCFHCLIAICELTKEAYQQLSLSCLFVEQVNFIHFQIANHYSVSNKKSFKNNTELILGVLIFIFIHIDLSFLFNQFIEILFSCFCGNVFS